MSLTDALMAQLAPHNVPVERFRDIVGRLFAAGIMVRQYGDDGVRVTIGEVEANSRLLEVAQAFGPR